MPGSTVGRNVGATDTIGNGADDGGNTPTTTAEDQIGAGGVDARVQDAGTGSVARQGDTLSISVCNPQSGNRPAKDALPA
jgi:hypothetical protein